MASSGPGGTITQIADNAVDSLVLVPAPTNSPNDEVDGTLTLPAPSNRAPTDIALSPATIAENSPANTTVGTFSTTDPDAGNTFTYSLVSGLGGTDNSSFAIVGNALSATSSFDFETKDSYSVRVRSTDQGGLFFEKVFTIGVYQR